MVKNCVQFCPSIRDPRLVAAFRGKRVKREALVDRSKVLGCRGQHDHSASGIGACRTGGGGQRGCQQLGEEKVTQVVGLKLGLEAIGGFLKRRQRHDTLWFWSSRVVEQQNIE